MEQQLVFVFHAQKDGSSKIDNVKINTLKVQQKTSGKIYNATIKEKLLTELSSSLEINQFVDLSDSSIDLYYGGS